MPIQRSDVKAASYLFGQVPARRRWAVSAEEVVTTVENAVDLAALGGDAAGFQMGPQLVLVEAWTSRQCRHKCVR